MKRCKKLILMTLLMAVAVLCCGVDASWTAPVTGPGSIPDYWETPNWANSPPLRKFVDTLPGLTAAGVNNLGQYIPVAIPDTTTYPGSDYYEIELGQYTKQMHTDLPPTTLRGYRQTNTTDATVSQFQYLGPLIIATKDRPIRVKFTNKLPTGAGGNLFLPVDTTVMGSGMGPLDSAGNPCDPAVAACAMYSQNRATLHLHGGRTPWVSDGTPHQWITPTGEATPYPKGVSVQNVPDMPDPGPGSQTFYWTNQQSARLMFYHDHAWGITRLNVYAGEAAGYLLTDPKEQELVTAGLIPATQIPLVVQFKTFVDATGTPATNPYHISNTDPTWNWGTGARDAAGNITAANTGDLWWPHVYMPAQNPFVMSGVAAFGRWMYGPWFWPATPVCGSSPSAVKPWCITEGTKPNPYYDPACVPDPTLVANNNFCQPPEIPGTPNVSWGAEAFLDTAVVNGTVFPSLTVNPQQYRLRILNADHDKFLNLQLYKASPIVSAITVASGGSGYIRNPAVTITNAAGDTTGKGASAVATVDLAAGSPTFGQVTAIDLTSVGSGYTAAPTVTIAAPAAGGTVATATAAIYTAPTEVGMIPAAVTADMPATWPVDGREGGVPDPATAGPAFIQIGTEGGFLPAPLLMPNQPVQWNLDPTMFNVGNVLNWADGGGTLMLGPAERADVIVDFTNYAGQTLILYNDAPSAWPALDPHYDYYTGAPDRRDIGAYGPTIPPGVGPNVRTVMQIKVTGAGGTAPADDFNPTTLANLETAFASTAATPGVFAASQPQVIVGQTAYNSTYNKTFPSMWPYWGYSRIFDTSLGFQSPAGVGACATGGAGALCQTLPMQPKAIHDEMGGTFDDFGRMAARLGLEVPGATAAISTFALQNYVDPPTEILANGEVQIWKITHNGVDTHPVHFHMMDVQLINRVGWDGFIRQPDPNELGWKDTIRTSPLEDTIVALRAVEPLVPFGQPESIRPLNPSVPLGSDMGFSQIDPLTGGAIVVPTVNAIYNFGYEYVWHCHILSHEENDMMRSIVFNAGGVLPPAAGVLTATLSGVAGAQQAALAWTDPTPVGGAVSQLGNPQNEIGFRIERAVVTGGIAGAYAAIGTAPANSTTFTDTALASGTTYRYRVIAFNAAGDAPASNTATVTTLSNVPVAPTNLAAAATAPTVTLTWTDNATNETGFTIQRARNTGFTTGLTTFTAAANATTFVDSTVAATTTYYYRVQAASATPSPWSNIATVTTAALPLAAPSNLAINTALTSRTGIRLTWTDNSNNEQGFQIWRSTTGVAGSFSQVAQVPSNATRYTNSGLRRGTTYWYQVRSFNATGFSAFSNTISGSTLP